MRTVRFFFEPTVDSPSALHGSETKGFARLRSMASVSQSLSRRTDMTIKLPLAVAAGCLCVLAHPASAQQAAAAPAAASTAVITPEIRAAVDRMASAMKSLQSLEFKADLVSEEVLADGQKIQSSSVMSASARRPDRLFIEIVSKRRNRQFYYDGKTLTVFGPVNKYYVTVPAPPTTAAMLHQVDERYGMQTPLLDVFEWGVTGVKLDKVTSAMEAGADTIGGKVCEQYAFRQKGVDWQVWIPQTEPALPCKLVIVDTVDPSQPAFSAMFTWTSAPQLADDRFAFVPPQGAKRIPLETPNVPGKQEVAPK
ncbi:MAG: DUF2092 domain-containing protein [Alphaproteobacteria bacterium]|nr:MAG: DUF2092 domain-containing protein [Alphaproteobacteria bacterium]